MIHALMLRWEQEQERQDFRAGMIASTIANVNRDPKRRHKPYEPADFMPYRRKEEPKPMSVEASLNYIVLLNAALGGEDLRVAA